MLSIEIKNHKNEVLSITQNPAYTIMSVTGLNPAAANINTVDAALQDGATFNSSKVGMRNIVINFVIENPAEINRIALYRYIKPKKSCTVYVKNGSRDVYIPCYVETLDIDLFENKQAAQISLLCTKPYFLGVETNEVTADNATFAVENSGDIETGAIFTLTATGGAIVNPTITNFDTGEIFKINYTIPAGAELTVNTNQGQKGVYLTNSGVVTNLINYVDSSSVWLQLDTGSNNFVCSSDSGMEYWACTVVFNSKFEGV